MSLCSHALVLSGVGVAIRSGVNFIYGKVNFASLCLYVGKFLNTESLRHYLSLDYVVS